MRVEFDDVLQRLQSWSIKPFDEALRIAGEILADIATLPARELRKLPQSRILTLLEIEEEFLLTPNGLILLDNIRDGMHGPYLQSAWRALRTLHQPIPIDVWEAFWDDFASDDALRHSSPGAVTGPALARGDQEFISRAIQVFDRIPPEDSVTRNRIEELLTPFEDRREVDAILAELLAEDSCNSQQ